MMACSLEAGALPTLARQASAVVVRDSGTGVVVVHSGDLQAEFGHNVDLHVEP